MDIVRTRLVRSPVCNPWRNLAWEEYLTKNCADDEAIFYLWQNAHTVVIGRNQNAWAECRIELMEKEGVTLARRSTGGGAVYHDLGNLNYSFITDDEEGSLHLERFTRPVVDALCALGLQAEASGRNDILVEGRKVSGTAQRRHGGRILHHGTLLFDANPGMVAGALNVDPEKFRSKSTKSVRSRIGNIRDFLPNDMELPAFWAYLKDALSGGGLTPGALSAGELAEVDRLKRKKYDTWEWNYSRSPKFDVRCKRYWDGGCLEANVSIANGVITDIRFFGDFLSVCGLEELVERLKGVTFRPEDVRAVLNDSPVGELFGGITADEVTATIFDL